MWLELHALWCRIPLRFRGLTRMCPMQMTPWAKSPRHAASIGTSSVAQLSLWQIRDTLPSRIVLVQACCWNGRVVGKAEGESRKSEGMDRGLIFLPPSAFCLPPLHRALSLQRKSARSCLKWNSRTMTNRWSAFLHGEASLGEGQDKLPSPGGRPSPEVYFRRHPTA